MKKIYLILLLVLAGAFSLEAQQRGFADSKKTSKITAATRGLPAKELFRRGRVYYMNGDFKKAKTFFAGVVGLEPENAEAWHFLGGAKHRLGDFSGAIRDYSRAIKLDPKAYHTFHNRALSKHHRQNLRGAIADYSKAISINRDYFRSWYFRGLAKFENGDYRGAIEDLSILLLMKPFHYKAWYVKGLAKHMSGDATGAAADFSQAARLANKKLPPYYKKINPFSVAKKKGVRKLKSAGKKEMTKDKAKSF